MYLPYEMIKNHFIVEDYEMSQVQLDSENDIEFRHARCVCKADN